MMLPRHSGGKVAPVFSSNRARWRDGDRPGRMPVPTVADW